jgi:hypothetical protein
MKTIVISYSLTGNNDEVATSIAKEFTAEHIRISEPNTRTMFTIILDILFNRTPKVNPKVENVGDYDLVIFMGPVWMGHVATPLRAYFKHLKARPSQYAFVSISGGADGANPKLADELNKRLGKSPVALIDLHIADLLPPNSNSKRKDTMAYRLNDSDVQMLTNKIVKTLHETMAKTGNVSIDN